MLDKLTRVLAAAALPLLLTSCGGGGGATQGSVLHGQVLMGYQTPLTGANVCVYPIAGGRGNTPLNATSGAQTPYFSGNVLISTTGYTYSYIGQSLSGGTPPSCGLTTDSNGNFSIDLTSFYGPVLIQVSGGSYNSTTLNNLTNTTSSLQAVAVSGGGGTVNALITPLTTIATNIALAPPLGTLSTRMDTSNYNSALAFVASEFGINSTAEFPVTAPTATSGTAAIASATSDYNKVLLGVQTYLATTGLCTSASSCGADANGTNLLEWATYKNAVSPNTTPVSSDQPTLNAIYTAFQTAYNTATSGGTFTGAGSFTPHP